MTAASRGNPGPDRPLEGIRVIDMAGHPGAYAAKLLGDLGADVIKVEPPGGDPLRSTGPFWHDDPHPDHSLPFWFYNTSKRSVVLDFSLEADRHRLNRLVRGADVLFQTSETAGRFHEDVGAENDSLVVVSISPFGQTGPRCGWKSCDLVAQAVSGMLYVNGFPDEAPIATVGLQAYHSTGVYAAIAALAALYARARTGLGQTIDMSLQEATAAAVEHVAPFFLQIGRIQRRAGSLHWTRYFRVAKCRDGYVLHCTLGDWTSLIEWVKADGKAKDLAGPEWEDFNHRRRNCVHLFDVLDEWAKDYDAADLLEGTQLRRIPYAALRGPESLPQDPQLTERGYFADVQHPELGRSVRYPGPPFRTSRAPWTPVHRPPLLGEHTDEVLSSLDRAPGRRARPPDQQPPEPSSMRPLEGVRILDFTWVVAGPTATRLLADLGAEVIKIERADSLDFGDRRGGFTGGLNRGKASTVINLSDPRGLELVKRLVPHVDVVVDNFSARVMHNWGLDYESLRAMKPDIIAVNMSGFGHDGPCRDYVSYGPTLQALAGYTLLMRHRDGEPAGFGFSYSDIVGGYSAALAVLTALWRRQRSGEGTHVDLAQFEASCAVFGPALLDVTENGRTIEPAGNASQEGAAAPHGVYRCKGDDRWCAIAVFGDEEWERFKTAIGHPSWTRDPRFVSLDERSRNRDALDRRVEEWTRERAPEDAAEHLQRAGVRAGEVADAEQLCAKDRHLHERGFWVRVPTPEGAEVTFDAPPYRFSRNQPFVSGPGPLLGEHTTEVLRRVLGLEDEAIASLRVAGVIV